MKNALPSDISQLLGGLTPQNFLSRHWHREPLLIRRAVPDMQALLTRAELYELASRDEVESRRVTREGRRWHLERGPFRPRALRQAPAHPWTLLVQGANLYSPDVDRLFRRFNFVPEARQDDLMISYAVDGGGVGPHFDSYDVFLLQAHGRRRWRLSMQKDRSLLPDAPLRILKHFRPTAAHVLEPGDMLYLPPGCAHDGVALGECMTYSIGFRAPSARELVRGLYEHLADSVERPGMYADPGLKATSTPALLPNDYVARARRLIGRLEPTRAQVEEFLGRYLTEPKANVLYAPPDAPLSRTAFARRLQREGAHLDRATRMLYRQRRLFINGEAVDGVAASSLMRGLADRREVAPGATCSPADSGLLYAWYESGWLHPGRAS